jgi:hypothetical protein
MYPLAHGLGVRLRPERVFDSAGIRTRLTAISVEQRVMHDDDLLDGQEADRLSPASAPAMSNW